MAVETERASAAAMPRPEDLGFDLSPGRPVLAGEAAVGDAPRSLEALLTAFHPQPALVVIDLRRMSFTVAPQIRGCAPCLVVAGELDVATTPMVTDALGFALAPSRPRSSWISGR